MIYRLLPLLYLCLNIGLCHAHPHEWMNIQITPEFNTHNEIIALEQTWMFDPLYAHILLEPVLVAPTNEAQQQGMKKIEEEIITKLAQNNYYTFSQTPFLPAQNQSLFIENGYLYFSFRLPLKNAQFEVSFKVYEPTYYVELRYDETQKTQWANGCSLTITESTPSIKIVQAAYALDIDATGPKNLGQYFAQISNLKCSPP